MSIAVPGFEVFLGPSMRGAPDDLRVPLQSILSHYKQYKIASQQISDRDLVDKLVTVLSATNGDANAFVERKYLSERQALGGQAIWDGGGEYEENRQCFLALLRAGVDVRFDNVGSALQHANFIVAEKLVSTGDEPAQRTIITSANLSPGSIGKHFNWLAIIDSITFASILSDVFEQIKDGDFREVFSTNSDATDKGVRLVVGSGGEVLEELTRLVASAQESIGLAVFNIANSSSVTTALIQAASRGVAVHGVVDGDQGTQSWDAVPRLRQAGADIKYYPGVMTGATGRMHYKIVVIDNETIYLGTANISRSATKSLEIGLFFSASSVFDGEEFVAGVQREIHRLYKNAV